VQPQILVNDVTGNIEQVFDAKQFPNRPEHLRHVNSYYAKQEFHDRAAILLCAALLRPENVPG